MKLFSTIPSHSIDLVICDLPYGRTRNSWDTIIPFDELLENYNLVIKENGAILLFADGMFMADLMQSNRKMWRYNIVWDKVLVSGFLNAKRMPLRSTEEIVVFYKKQPTYNPQFFQGKPLHGTGTKLEEKAPVNNNYGNFKRYAQKGGDTKKYPKSLVTYSRSSSAKMQHPTQKPVDLLEYLIKTYSNPGDTVLDNCMGVGSTGVACVNTGRNFVGFEIDDKYFDLATQNIKCARAKLEI